MKQFAFRCAYCAKDDYRDARRYNEAIKRGWEMFCSAECSDNFRTKRKLFHCTNLKCKKTFERSLAATKKSVALFCSRSCAMIVNNKKYPRKKGARLICQYCSKDLAAYGRIKFCSKECHYRATTVMTEPAIIRHIQSFYKKHGRIPLKRESDHYNAARDRFGTWNNAIKAAGFEPNPVMFSKKYIARDGHTCDSMAEKIIDDWLCTHHIAHERHVFYPNNRFTTDFKVGDVFIEFFGLAGELHDYDTVIEQKEKLAQENNIRLVKIYPKDLIPEYHLNSLLTRSLLHDRMLV